MKNKIRSPILVMLGHVDHGKTTLLDKIRGTAIAKGEPGAITQHISSSYIPFNVFVGVCGDLLNRLKIDLTIPGLLWIDSPGHEAFTTLRKRGGAIADLAVLVVDVNEGFQPQTEESLNYLRQFKTPFVVALTKIDTITGWNPKENACFLESFGEQSERAQNELEEKLYRVIGQLGAKGLQAERYDRVSDYTKQIAIVPVSGKTGEGIPDLLMVLAGICQKYLKRGLEITEGEGKGTVLEVKEYKGLGTTIDVILYDGEIRKNDYIVIASMKEGEKTITTRVKALLKPRPLKELRVEKNFQQVDSVSAADGIKIAAPGLEAVVAGSPLRAVNSKKGLEKAIKEVEDEVEEVEIKTEKEGVLIRADTLGSLEALIKTLNGIGLPIRKALVGDVAKADILEMRSLEEPIIFAFNVNVPKDAEKLAKDNRVALFSSNVIYTLLERYEKWVKDRKKREEQRLLETVTHPGRIRVLKGFVFRQKNPAIFGIEVVKGIIKPGYKLKLKNKIIGEIKEIQSEGENIQEAAAGQRVALSMEDVTIGRDIKENDELENYISRDDMEKLQKVKAKLTPEERELLEEMEGGDA